MTGLEWFLWIVFVGIYITALFTVCLLTFRKGHTILGIVGIFFPLLWFIGAILPAKKDSRYDVEQRAYYQEQSQAQMREYTS